jgi:hypothetical protein
MYKAFALIFALLCGSVCAPLMAQTPAPQQIVPSEKSTSNNIVSDFLSDQKDIWTAPLHIKRGDVEWLAPIGAGAAALFATDHQISNAVKGDTSLRGPSNAISNVGSIAPYAIPGAMWFLGAVKHNSHTAEAGRLGTEAELDTEVVVQVLKLVTQRTRPNLADNQSFPSGHAASAFALAAVMSSEYHDKPLVVVGSYGFATAVSLARVGGLNHFPSDVLVGAVIGELIGRYVVHHHAHQAQ